jgi:hypothetical protein
MENTEYPASLGYSQPSVVRVQESYMEVTWSSASDPRFRDVLDSRLAAWQPALMVSFVCRGPETFSPRPRSSSTPRPRLPGHRRQSSR